MSLKETKLVVYSYAKLNLHLEVLGKRRDQYHNIRTVFERIGLCDKILLKPRPDKKIRILCKHASVPKDRTNLCYRSAQLIQKEFDIARGLDIGIIKRIPVGAGLGGGSSNAASVLLGLNKLWKLELSQKRLVGLAKKLGCDVPFFVYDVPFAKAGSRGDAVRPLEGLSAVELWHILVVPKIHVSTPFIYKKWDDFFAKRVQRKTNNPGLTRAQLNDNILLSALKKNTFFQKQGFLFNSLEPITIKFFPEVGRVKEALAARGVKSILMSGSGPAVFGIVSSRKEAESISRKLREKNKTWRVFVTRTL